MKIAIITDTHFGIRGDGHIFLEHQKKFYDEIFFPTLAELNIDTVLHLGDLFDRRKYINFNTLAKAKEMFLDPMAAKNITMHLCVGNHDVFFKDDGALNSPRLLLPEYPLMRVYDNNPVELDFNGFKILMSPWITAANHATSMAAFASTSATYLMGHFGFQGYEMQRGRLAEDGLSRDTVATFQQVFSGHFHHPSTAVNISYLGAPYEMDWSDYDGKRGFHILDTETLDFTFIANTFRIFRKITYDDTYLTVEDLDDLELSGLTSTYLKVIVKNKTNPYIFDLFLDRLSKAGAADIKVVEEHLNFDIIGDDILLDQAQDTMTLLRTYVEGLGLKTDANDVINVLDSLYHEALAL